MCNRHCSKCGVQIALVQLTWKGTIGLSEDFKVFRLQNFGPALQVGEYNVPLRFEVLLSYDNQTLVYDITL